jgi:hypothetical protein
MRRLIIAGLVLLLCSPAAFADKKNKHKAKGKDKHRDSVHVTFTLEERHAFEGYYVERHGRGNCPPGLAKKNNGCLPPGQAKKRYAVGHPLPRGVIFVEPPPDLLVLVGAPPPGYRYVMVDGDLLKLAVGTAFVVDAIDGFVH